MKIHFRTVKDFIALPLHLVIKFSAYLPEPLSRAGFGAMALCGKAVFHLPNSHVRRAIENVCAVAGHGDAKQLCYELMDNVARVARTFGKLLRYGPEIVDEVCAFDEEAVERMRAAWKTHGGAVLVVPHCVGSVLSAARFTREFPTVIMVRESHSSRRAALMLKYFQSLGGELILVRRNAPTAVTRDIIRALKDGKLVIGTTDLIRKKEDTVPAKMFGRDVWLPAWPARFAARRKVPIVPGYIRVVNGKLSIVPGDVYLEDDVAVSTQRWASFFEQSIRAYPADWMFMFEKRWARLLADVAEEKRRASP